MGASKLKGARIESEALVRVGVSNKLTGKYGGENFERVFEMWVEDERDCLGVIRRRVEKVLHLYQHL